MKQDRDFDRITRSWLEVGPNSMPDRALDAALDEIHSTRQVRFGALRRATGISSRVLRLAAAASLVIVVASVAVLVASRLYLAPSIGQLPPSDGNVIPSPTGGLNLLAPLGYPGQGTIAFVRNDPSVNGDATWVVNPDGTGETTLRLPPAVSDQYGDIPGTGCCAVFSPDGKKLAVGTNQVNPVFGAVSGTQIQQGTWLYSTVVNLSGEYDYLLPRMCGGCASLQNINAAPRAWSPDGDFVAIEAWSDTHPEKQGIYIAPTCTGQNCAKPGSTCGPSGCDWQAQVTGANRDVPVAFSPDSKRLLFIRLSYDNQGSLMVLTIASGAITQLSPGGMLVYANSYFGPAASWSPDGSRVAFAATDASGNTARMSAFVVEADGGSPPVTIALPTAYLTSAKWSPDGTWIAYDRLPESSSSLFHDLYIVHPDGSGAVNLTSDFAPGICCARWSPDSQALLGAGTVGADEQSYLFIVPIDGSRIYQVTTVPAFYTDYSWGPASR